jgi:hypothetical protein
VDTEWEENGVKAVASSPTNSHLAWGAADGSVVLARIRWRDDVPPSGNAERRHRFTGGLVAKSKSLEDLWAELGGEDATKAYGAVLELSCLPHQFVPFARARLKPAMPADHMRLALLLADLDAGRFSIRQRALQELEKLGDLARPALERARNDNPSAEKARLIAGLLQKLEGPVSSADRLREARAVEALEQCHTRDADQLIAELASGAPEAWLSQQAKKSLQRQKLEASTDRDW